jgi:hypothetical protein
VPGTGFCACRGNLNASEEIVWREKKLSTFEPKVVHIGTFIGQFSTGFGTFWQWSLICELTFGLSEITEMKGGRSQSSIPIARAVEAGFTLRER